MVSKPTTTSEANTLKNKVHYDAHYSKAGIAGILKKLNALEAFLADATQTDTSWVCMFKGHFKDQLKGRTVLELGCGDCTLAAVMAALGAEVFANDISDRSGAIIEALNQAVAFRYPITFIPGNFLEATMPRPHFDIVVGKAFLHHLTHEQEVHFLETISQVLEPHGFARFVEPAINSTLLDRLRWMVPVPGRPSSLQRNKFKEWQALDPHPDRDNSSTHYQGAGRPYFEEVNIIPLGSLERFHRLFPRARWNREFRRKAYRWEGYLPRFLRMALARTQTITYSSPKH